MANVPKRSPEKDEVILDALRAHPSYAAAARKARISRTTLTRWRKDDPDFEDAVQAARDEGGEALEDELVQRATRGKDTTALIFALKAWKPERYRETHRHEHSGPNGGAIPVTTIEVVVGDEVTG